MRLIIPVLLMILFVILFALALCSCPPPLRLVALRSHIFGTVARVLLHMRLMFLALLLAGATVRLIL